MPMSSQSAPQAAKNGTRVSQLAVEFTRATDQIRLLYERRSQSRRDPQEQQLFEQALDSTIALFAQLGEMLLYAEAAMEDACDALADARATLEQPTLR
jgi:hypothetical protein